MSNYISNKSSYALVVPAGGSGQRLSIGLSQDNSSLSKQFLVLSGKTILQHSIAPFLMDVDCKAIIIAAPKDNLQKVRDLFSDSRVQVVLGGESRMHSVLNGLDCLRSIHSLYSQVNWVMVHDAARANIRSGDIQKLKQSVLSGAEQDPDCGGILAVPVRDTLKLSSSGEVLKTLDRADIWQALTPQMFHLDALYSALSSARQNNLQVTDEASAMEMSGSRVILVKGRADNLKLTYPEDLPIMEKLLEDRITRS